MNRRVLLTLPLLAAIVLGGGLALAQDAVQVPTAEMEASALALAKRQAREATRRSLYLERQAARATSEAAKIRADAAALAARIQAAEADITAAETRIRIIENLRAEQRARLAQRQGPVVRLTAALQTLARRPPALALVQPGSLDELVHVRSLLASTMPVIRARTANLREEIEKGNALRQQAEVAVASLVAGQQDLRKQRIALAQVEARQRVRSQNLTESAMFESDRALALGEEARDLQSLVGTLEYQAKLRERLSELPGPMLRPRVGAAAAPAPLPQRAVASPGYILPVDGRVVTGMGEISDAGVHARGLTFQTRPSAQVVAPRNGRVAYAGRFRGYGDIVILEHGGGWTSLITNLAATDVRVGDTVPMGSPIGRAGTGRRPNVTVELRRAGRPVAIAPFVG